MRRQLQDIRWLAWLHGWACDGLAEGSGSKLCEVFVALFVQGLVLLTRVVQPTTCCLQAGTACRYSGLWARRVATEHRRVFKQAAGCIPSAIWEDACVARLNCAYSVTGCMAVVHSCQLAHGLNCSGSMKWKAGHTGTLRRHVRIVVHV